MARFTKEDAKEILRNIGIEMLNVLKRRKNIPTPPKAREKMRSQKEIEQKFMQMGMTKSKNRDNYWYKIGFSQALLFCLGKDIEEICFKNDESENENG